MKKIFLKLALGASLVACVAACSDQFLQEKRDYSRMVPIDVFSDPVQANGVFQQLYLISFKNLKFAAANSDPLMRQNKSGGQLYVFSEEYPSGFSGINTVGDNKMNGDNSKPSKAGNFFGNPTYWNDPKDGGNNFNNPNRETLFGNIYHINNFLIEIDRTGREAYPNDAFWDALKGQAIFLRAWIQFCGVSHFGGPPYYPTETDQASPDSEEARKPVPEIIEKICADFETAADLLPAKWDDANHGRFTSVAALAMLARVRLFAASPIFNASWDNASGQRWQLALDAGLRAEAAAKAAGYGSSVNNIEDWDRAFYGYDGTFNPEAIITVPKANMTIDGQYWSEWEWHVRPAAVKRNGATAFNGGGLPAPDQIMLKFPMSSGLAATPANGYDDAKFYRNRDPRFYKTFTFLRVAWPGVDHKPFPVFVYRIADTQTTLKTKSLPERDSIKVISHHYRPTDGATGSDDRAMGRSRALVWKLSDPNVAVSLEQRGGTDVIDYRYGELLLNIAEAYAAQGNTGKTVEYLTAVRNRVGAGTSDLAGLSDRYSLIKAVLNERAVELAYEGKRAWDMRRWLLHEGGAGFDPRLAGINDATNEYDPERAWGVGWKLYNGLNGRDSYTKDNNVLTRLGLPRFSGTRRTSQVYVYDMETTYAEPGTNFDNLYNPLVESAAFNAITPLKKEMTDAQRNATFDQWEAFLATAEGQKMKLIDPNVDLFEISTTEYFVSTSTNNVGDKVLLKDRRYAMDSGTSVKALNYQFSWRGWYSIYPIHYDMYNNPAKGNIWLNQTEGWCWENINAPKGTLEEQLDESDGKPHYIYNTPE